MTKVALDIDGVEVFVDEGATLLDACRSVGKQQPTLCYLETLAPVNVCRVCVVEVEGSRTLVPSCSRKAEPGMVIQTDSERVRHSRRMVFEMLASSVNLALVDQPTRDWMERYGVDPFRFGPPAPPTSDRDHRHAGHHHPVIGDAAETVHQPVKVDNNLYVRDYSRCILCYKCVEACGDDAQNTFAIAVAGRGFDARISTEFDVALPEGACVFCGNCIGVCPTGALMFRSEHELRQAGLWEEERQSVTRTVCSFCGVGCNLELHVQDNRIVKVTSPQDHSVTEGHLCIKGRFGYEYVQELGDLASTPVDVVLRRARSDS
ncbi:MAG TPA: 2Fe-2S iron-sulfur cluster-binding protein [Acidimicrobiia bacterium]|nr:2Fe-2S iron-sulfur cluster-binding protein [Acidimicrobiia bacterium]